MVLLNEDQVSNLMDLLKIPSEKQNFEELSNRIQNLIQENNSLNSQTQSKNANSIQIKGELSPLEKILKIPGEMFMFLILCPDSFRPWMVFYKDLLKNKSADQLLLTLNRIMKGSKANGNSFIHDLAREIFMKIHSSITIPKNFEKDGILIN